MSASRFGLACACQCRGRAGSKSRCDRARREGGALPIDRLSPEDAAILALESPSVAGHTCKVLTLEPGEPLEVGALRARVAAGLAAAPRLCRRVSTPPGAPPAWVEDPEFDLARHVRAVPAPDRLDDAALTAVAARTMRERLDRAHPLWSLELVQAPEGGPAALVWKLHHALADGTEALRLADAVLWDSAPQAPPGSGGFARSSAASAAGGLLAAARSPSAWRAVAARSPSAWRAVAAQAARLPGAVWRDLRPGPRAAALDAVPGALRAVAFGAVALDDLKRIGHARPQRTTVNDVVLALLAGALRGWLAHHGGAPHELRVKVPVSLHDRHAHPDALANRDSFLCVGLPLDEADPLARLDRIAAETRLRKREHDAETLDALFAQLRHAPRPVAQLAARVAAGPRAFALEVSNVPGPQEPRWVLGRRVRALRSLAEIGRHHALRVTAISLDGTLHLGLCADAAAVADVDVIADGMAAEARELLARATG